MEKLIVKKTVFLISLIAAPFMQASTILIHGWTSCPAWAIEKHAKCFSSNEHLYVPAMPCTITESWGNPMNKTASYLAKRFWDRNVNRSNSYFGQTKDIETLKQCVDEVATKGEDIILYGLCRGGSTVLNYLGEHYNPAIKAIILDSTPANISEIFDSFFASWGLNQQCSRAFFKFCASQYPKDAPASSDYIASITAPKNIPILILHSLEDQHFPFKNALEIYVAFKNAGFINVHLATLAGQHSSMMRDDTLRYRQTIHTFYKHCNFSYDHDYALKDLHTIAWVFNYNDDAIGNKYSIQQADAEIALYYKNLHQKFLNNKFWGCP